NTYPQPLMPSTQYIIAASSRSSLNVNHLRGRRAWVATKVPRSRGPTSLPPSRHGMGCREVTSQREAGSSVKKRGTAMPTVSRRTVLRAGVAVAGAALLSACTPGQEESDFVAPNGDEVRAAEARRTQGPVREVALIPIPGPVDLGGLTVTTWTYGGRLPGNAIRIKAGEVISAAIHNGLPID